VKIIEIFKFPKSKGLLVIKIFKKILVGFDGSEHSKKALETAILLAKIHDAKIKVIEAIDHPPPAVEVYVKDDIRDRERIIKHKEMIGILSQERGVDIEYQAMRGDPATVISKLAETENFDLIVVGNRGIKGFKKLFIESVSSKVVQNSNRSILVVKN